MKKVVLVLIRFYQNYLSFDTGILRFFALGNPVCRHSPSCSEYTYQAIEKHGVTIGLRLGLLRILSCK